MAPMAPLGRSLLCITEVGLKEMVATVMICSQGKIKWCRSHPCPVTVRLTYEKLSYYDKHLDLIHFASHMQST